MTNFSPEFEAIFKKNVILEKLLKELQLLEAQQEILLKDVERIDAIGNQRDRVDAIMESIGRRKIICNRMDQIKAEYAALMER